MTITLRRTKQAPLTIDELDDNFADLDDRLEKLQTLLKKQEMIAEIVQEDNILKFKGLSGNDIGRATFPPQLLNYKGVFKQNTLYHKGDLVIHHNKAYQALCSTTPESPFKPEEWQLALEFETVSDKKTSSIFSTGGIPKYLENDLPTPIPGELIISITDKGANLLIGQEKEWVCLTPKKSN